MKTCTDVDRLLTPYTDGLATAADASSVEEHLTVCGPCRELAAAERVARRVVRERADELRATAPAALHARCRAAASTPQLVPAAGARRRWIPMSLAAAAVLFVAAALGLVWLRDDASTVLAAELALDHVKCFALTDTSGRPPDAEMVAQSFARQYGWSVDVPAGLASEDLELLGGRRCVYHDGAMAHVLYRLHGEPLSLFVLPEHAQARQAVEAVGHRAVLWEQRGQTYAVVGQESPAALERIATYVRTGTVVVP